MSKQRGGRPTLEQQLERARSELAALPAREADLLKRIADLERRVEQRRAGEERAERRLRAAVEGSVGSSIRARIEAELAARASALRAAEDQINAVRAQQSQALTMVELMERIRSDPSNPNQKAAESWWKFLTQQSG